MGDPERWVRGARSTAGKRIMGFGHRIYRAEDPRSRILKRTAKELGSPQDRGRRAARAGRAGGAPGAASRPRARDERRVLLGDRPRRRRDPAAARARDVRLLARRRLVGAHPRAEAHRPPVPARRRATSARRPGRSPLSDLASAAAEADELAAAGAERELADAAGQVGRRARGRGAQRRLPRAGGRLPRDRPVPVPPEARAAAARARGREPGGAAARRCSRSSCSPGTGRRR